MRRDLVAACEETAARNPWHGFKARDVVAYAKRKPHVAAAISKGELPRQLLLIKISACLNGSKFNKCPRFLRISATIPGIWKAVDHLNSIDTMAAVAVRRQLSSEHDRKADKFEKVAHLMALHRLGFREAWDKVA